MASDIRLLITTGDTDGIGWEVTAKALHAIGPKPGFQFFFYRHLKSSQNKPAIKSLALLHMHAKFHSIRK
jgi:4-hydroxy-L-threonine phosphate dehydrogenase PdxA